MTDRKYYSSSLSNWNDIGRNITINNGDVRAVLVLMAPLVFLLVSKGV